VHVRALHDTWGVALGLLVGVDPSGQRVTIGSGFAYDRRGREIVLSSEVSLGPPIPPSDLTGQPVVYDLLCSYAGPEDLPEVPADGLGCGGTEPRDRPMFRWALAGPPESGVALPLGDDVRMGDEIPLGRFLLGANGVLSGPDPTIRPAAHALLRPHVGFGVTPASLPWQASLTGLSLTIDTRAGGFSSIPLYFASLVSNPWAGDPSVVGPFLSISAPSRESFSLTLLSPEGGLEETATTARVLWIGVEPFTGCQPSFTFLWLPNFIVFFP
jgi:hypothetical protein